MLLDRRLVMVAGRLPGVVGQPSGVVKPRPGAGDVAVKPLPDRAYGSGRARPAAPWSTGDDVVPPDERA